MSGGRILNDVGGIQGVNAAALREGQGVVESGEATKSSFNALAGDGTGSTVESGLAFAQLHQAGTQKAMETVTMLTSQSNNAANDIQGIDTMTAGKLA